MLYTYVCSRPIGLHSYLYAISKNCTCIVYAVALYIDCAQFVFVHQMKVQNFWGEVNWKKPLLGFLIQRNVPLEKCYKTLNSNGGGRGAMVTRKRIEDEMRAICCQEGGTDREKERERVSDTVCVCAGERVTGKRRKKLRILFIRSHSAWKMSVIYLSSPQTGVGVISAFCGHHLF